METAAASVGEGQRCRVGCVCVVLGASVEPLELWGLSWRLRQDGVGDFGTVHGSWLFF